jgi:ribosomal protein L14E/L6E/L27E
MDVKQGSVVMSIAGHDKGRLHAVYEVNDPYVLLIDGRRRPVEHPKRKKAIHTQLISTDSPLVHEHEAWTNRKVREAIRSVAHTVGDTDLMKEDSYVKR